MARKNANNTSASDDTTYYDCFFRRAQELFKVLTKPFFLAFLGLLLLTISALSQPMEVDEGIWSYMGRVWAENGILPYSGSVDNKPPGILLLFYTSHSLFGTNVWFPRLAGILASFVTSLCLYRLICKLANHTVGVMGMVLYICLMPSRMFQGAFTAHTETFMVFFVVLGFLLITVSMDWKGYRYYAAVAGAGFCVGSAIAFKQVAIFDCAALFIFTAYCIRTRREHQSIRKTFGLISLGILSANILSVIPLLASGGSLLDYVEMVWIGLMQGRETKISIVDRIANIIPAWSHNALIVPYIGIIGFVLNRKSFRRNMLPVTPLLLWLALDFISVNSAGTYYRHQYRQMLPPFCIVFGIFFDFLATKLSVKGQPRTSFRTSEKIVLGIILATLVCYVPFEDNYEKGFKVILFGRENPNKKLGLYVRQITEKHQYIYVFGRGMDQILSYSDRLAPTPYFNWLFFSYPKATERVQRDITEKKPALILLKLEENYREVPAWLQRIVDTQYVKSETKYNFDIFIRKTRKSFDTRGSGK